MVKNRNSLENVLDSMSDNLIKKYLKKQLEQMDNYQLSAYLIEHRNLLKKNIIRNIIFSNDRHYAFVWVVQGCEKVSEFFDDNMIDRILNDSKSVDKLKAILSYCKDISPLLSDDRILDKIFSYDLTQCFLILTYESAMIVMNYMIKNKLLSYFNKFNNYVQDQLLKDESMRAIILNSEDLKTTVKNIDQEGFGILISEDKFKKVLLTCDINYIRNFVTHDVVFPLDVGLSDNFKKNFVGINDVTDYRLIMNKLEINNSLCAYEIDTMREKKYDEIIFNYKDGYSKSSRLILNNHQDIDEDLYLFLVDNQKDITPQSIYEYDSIRFRDILIDRFFKDIPSNFLKNLKVMINYIDKILFESFDKTRYTIYKKILNFNNLSFNERMDLYNTCKNIPDIQSQFYDDYRFCRNHTYSNLINSSISFNNCKLKKTNEFGVDIYVLNGEKFFAFVHITDVFKSVISKKDSDIWKEANREFLSLSYIGDKYLNLYKDPRQFIIFGFSSLDYNRINHVRESDSYSNYGFDNIDASVFVQKMYTPDDFVNNTKGYNEIVFQEYRKDIPLSEVKPDYVVCYDNVCNGDILVAKKYNIPIVLINTKKYDFKITDLCFDDDEDTYTM